MTEAEQDAAMMALARKLSRAAIALANILEDDVLREEILMEEDDVFWLLLRSAGKACRELLVHTFPDNISRAAWTAEGGIDNGEAADAVLR